MVRVPHCKLCACNVSQMYLPGGCASQQVGALSKRNPNSLFAACNSQFLAVGSSLASIKVPFGLIKRANVFIITGLRCAAQHGAALAKDQETLHKRSARHPSCSLAKPDIIIIPQRTFFKSWVLSWRSIVATPLTNGSAPIKPASGPSQRKSS